MQNNSPIKNRIIRYVDIHYASRREFYEKTNVSRGTLENNTGISEETLTKIFAQNPVLSCLWVVTGEGPMLLSDGEQPDNGMTSMKTEYSGDLINYKDCYIQELKERVREQNIIIMQLIKNSCRKYSEK